MPDTKWLLKQRIDNQNRYSGNHDGGKLHASGRRVDHHAGGISHGRELLLNDDLIQFHLQRIQCLICDIQLRSHEVIPLGYAVEQSDGCQRGLGQRKDDRQEDPPCSLLRQSFADSSREAGT